MILEFTDGNFGAPANANVIETLVQHFDGYLPQFYIDFLMNHNGGEGFVGNNYLVLWQAEDIVRYNEEYEVSKYAPGILFFGSNGGGEGYAFDCRKAYRPIVRVPFIGMSLNDADWVCNNLTDLFLSLRSSGDEKH